MHLGTQSEKHQVFLYVMQNISMGLFPADRRLCSRMRLWEFDHLYVFEPLEGGFTELLSINRKSGELELISKCYG